MLFVPTTDTERGSLWLGLLYHQQTQNRVHYGWGCLYHHQQTQNRVHCGWGCCTTNRHRTGITVVGVVVPPTDRTGFTVVGVVRTANRQRTGLTVIGVVVPPTDTEQGSLWLGLLYHHQQTQNRVHYGWGCPYRQQTENGAHCGWGCCTTNRHRTGITVVGVVVPPTDRTGFTVVGVVRTTNGHSLSLGRI